MKGKVATSIMRLQEKQYTQIGSTRSSLRLAGTPPKRNIKITQYMWKECNKFLHPLFYKRPGIKRIQYSKTNIFTELNLKTKYTRKGKIHLMKDSE